MHIPALNLENPVLVKELRSRMRRGKAYWVILAYLTLLSLVLVITYAVWWQSREYQGGSFLIGRMFFTALFMTQVGLVCLIAPALTAGTITLEKEQRTYDLLATTPMSARSIVLGKMVSALSFIVLLLTSSLPLASVCFLLGGVSPGEILFAYLTLLFAAFFYGSIGLTWSTIARNTATATVMTYLTVVAIFFVSAMPLGLESLQTLNPMGALEYGVEMETYYAFTLPAWIPGLILNALAALLLVVVSMSNLEHRAIDRSAALRVLGFLLCFALVFFVLGAVFVTYQGSKEWISFAQRPSVFQSCWMLTLTLILIAVPIYATGEPRGDARVRSYLLDGWNPRVFLRSVLESALPFVIVLLLVSAVVFLLGFPMTGMRTGPGMVGDVLLAVLVSLPVVLTFGLLGIILSHALKSRWSAMAATYLIIAAAVIIPMMAIPFWEIGDKDFGKMGYNPLWLTMYLSPYLAVVSIPEAGLLKDLPDPSAGDGVPLYVVSLIIYALTALILGVVLRGVLRAREAPVGRSEEV